ncbi:MAG: tetratricopeptide repeat protein [Candidatus Thiodiazotropha sp.]
MKVVKSRIGQLGKLFLIAAVTLSIAACQMFGPGKTEEPADTMADQTQEMEPLPPPDDLSPSKRVRKAMQQLQNGEYDQARDQLNWALQEKPNLQIATQLLEQLDADPIEYLGLKNFYYTVQPGDSLSLISKKFLNDPMKFVILARYNKLDNPSRLAPGQRIRIPGEMPAEVPHKPSRKPVKAPVAAPVADQVPVLEEQPISAEVPMQPESSSEVSASMSGSEAAVEVETRETVVLDEPPAAEQTQIVVDDTPNAADTLDTAERLHSTGDLAGAIALLESEAMRSPQAEEINTTLALYYREYANQMIAQEQLDPARSVLEKLIILDASDEQAINTLIMVEDRIEARKLFSKAAGLQQSGDLEASYKTYSQGLTYDPDNQTAVTAQKAVLDQLTDSYHRQAMQHFRKQELDQAIEYWDKILELDPNHSLAPGYKARALEMKQQLQKIAPAK